MKPVLLTVDDDPEVLNAIERDLRHHFRADYRVVKASSGAEALETVQQLVLTDPDGNEIGPFEAR